MFEAIEKRKFSGSFKTHILLKNFTQMLTTNVQHLTNVSVVSGSGLSHGKTTQSLPSELAHVSGAGLIL